MTTTQTAPENPVYEYGELEYLEGPSSPDEYQRARSYYLGHKDDPTFAAKVARYDR